MERKRFKRKIGLGKTSLRLDGVHPNHPLVRGVMRAREEMGGEFPECVRTITVNNEVMVEDPDEPWYHTLGYCERRDGVSKITLNGGSIARTNICSGKSLDTQSMETTLHEVQHALDKQAIHNGFFFDRKPTVEEQEQKAQYAAITRKLDFKL